MTDTIDTEAAASARPEPKTAGARLRAAREAAGLSLDAVAQQLKLAPRQVRALEEDDFQHLPGRTFVRGFARNYARLVRLDPDAVLALLPAAEDAPALERPTLTGARRPMGEIPVERVAKPSAARRLLPLLLVAVIGAAGYYEYVRPRPPATAAAGAGNARVPGAPPAPPSAPASTTGSATTSTALPNPVPDASRAASSESQETASAPVGTTAAGTSATPATSGSSPGTAPPGAAASSPAPGAASPPAASENLLVLTFKGTSWAEVKDASGRVILQMTGGAGMTQTVSGTPPFELALGNAREVAVTFRGQSLDLAPYTRGSVARVALR